MLLQVHIITASCENMIDGRGMRPGDILQAANGKTVEVCPMHQLCVRLTCLPCRSCAVLSCKSLRVRAPCQLAMYTLQHSALVGDLQAPGFGHN